MAERHDDEVDEPNVHATQKDLISVQIRILRDIADKTGEQNAKIAEQNDKIDALAVDFTAVRATLEERDRIENLDATRSTALATWVGAVIVGAPGVVSLLWQILQHTHH